MTTQKDDGKRTYWFFQPIFMLVNISDKLNWTKFDSSRVQQTSKKFGCQTRMLLKSVGAEPVKIIMPIVWASNHRGVKNVLMLNNKKKMMCFYMLKMKQHQCKMTLTTVIDSFLFLKKQHTDPSKDLLWILEDLWRGLCAVNECKLL